MHFKNVSCSNSESILPKVILKYHVSILTRHPAYPKIHFKIIKAVNTLSQLFIHQIFQGYISVSAYHCRIMYFMKFLSLSLSLFFFIAYKNDEWCHFVVRIDSSAYFALLPVCRFFLFLLPFFFSFVYYTTSLGIEISLSTLCRVSRGMLLKPCLVINVTGLV